MKALWLKFRLARAFFALVRDPRKTEKIFELSDLGRRYRGKSAEVALREILHHPKFLELFRDRYNPRIDLQALRVLPPHTFGRAIADFLDRNTFEPNGFPSIAANSTLDYLAGRVRGTHDLWHVLTGYGVHVSGELALQAFTLAQVRSPLSALILAGGLLHLVLLKPTELVDTFEEIIEGYRRGKHAMPLLFERLEDGFARPLTELRAQFHLQN